MRRTTASTARLSAAVLAVLFVSPAALAADGEPKPPVTPFLDSGNTLPDLGARTSPRLGKWYGWQTLIADAALIGCAAGLDQPLCLAPVPAVGLFVHRAHGNRGIAGGSIALRTLGPLLGAAMGRSVADCPEIPSPKPEPATTDGHGNPLNIRFEGEFLGAEIKACWRDEAATGALIGAMVAAVVDGAIGFTRLAPEAPAAPSGRPAIAPRLSVGQNIVSVGLGAAF
jgi:hypothetical protein